MSNNKQTSLRDFMSKEDREAMQGLPTYHSICIKWTGVARPGKTARDRKKREARE